MVLYYPLSTIVIIFAFTLLIYDDYLYNRGRNQYMVVVGIKGEGIDSWEEYKMYANYPSQAEYKAKKIYAKENEVDYNDLESTITGKV